MAEWSSQIPFTPGEVIGGKYRVERMLGQGGMGAVVEAMHLQLEEPVALKVMLTSPDVRPDAVQRFLREGRAASKIKSEHVARVLDVGTLPGGMPYLVMELLEGEDLSSRLARVGPLPVTEAVGHALDACDALAEAHAKGIIHRDIKPSNLFLASRAVGRPCLKVLDFGVSKIASGTSDGLLTSSRTIIGTPFYMAPEQMRASNQVDARADVWSLGATLYELLAGNPPFLADDITVLVARVLHDEPPPLATLRSGLPARLIEVIARSLAKDPAQRFPDIASFAAALAPFRDAHGDIDPVAPTERPAQLSAAATLDAPSSLARTAGVARTTPGQPLAAPTLIDDPSVVPPPPAPSRPRSARPVVAGLVLLAAAGALALGWSRRASVATADPPLAATTATAEAAGPTAAPVVTAPGTGAATVAAVPSGGSLPPPVSSPARPAGRPPPAGARPVAPPRTGPEKPPSGPSGLPADRD